MSKYSAILAQYYQSELNEQEALEKKLIKLNKAEVIELLPLLPYDKSNLMLTAYLLSEWSTLKIPEVSNKLAELAKSEDLDIQFYAAGGLAKLGDLKGFRMIKEFILQNYRENVKNYIPLAWIKEMLREIHYPESRYLLGMMLN